jgi:hypothetical protein
MNLGWGWVDLRGKAINPSPPQPSLEREGVCAENRLTKCHEVQTPRFATEY